MKDHVIVESVKICIVFANYVININNNNNIIFFIVIIYEFIYRRKNI
jgi:hypothetical protein